MKQKDFEKIQRLFVEAYNEKRILHPLRKYEDKKDMAASRYMVYSYAALPALIEKMKQVSESEALQKYNARFTIDQDGDCWFAFEGCPGDIIEYDDYTLSSELREQAPAHSDMTPTHTSMSAGIIVFSKDYRITKITNFSGHYRPTPGSLVWIIGSLVELGANFTPDVGLGFYWKNDRGLKSKNVSLPQETLRTLLPTDWTSRPDRDYKVIVYSHGECTTFSHGEEPHFKSVSKNKRHRSEMPESHEVGRSIFSKFSTQTSVVPNSPVTKRGTAIDFSVKTNSMSIIAEEKVDSGSSISAAFHRSSPPSKTATMCSFFSDGTSTPPPQKQTLVAAIEPFSDDDDDEQSSPKNT